MTQAITRRDIVEIKDAQRMILEAINGNHKPGLKTEMATTMARVDELCIDIGTIRVDLKERDKERRAFISSLVLLALGNAAAVLISVLK